ncbi:hypothetical protein EUGRSUZ_I00380 [Eucalyptus grandis]|uniref:Uncharacterized protein n=2 Tax=Eucalyptus grandis TaxID=71139 RepID=A0ACC3JD71_EUCGR|nr:hypothetical protein EUGRSUZ_I00380 [Eucalyptus grandis]
MIDHEPNRENRCSYYCFEFDNLAKHVHNKLGSRVLHDGASIGVVVAEEGHVRVLVPGHDGAGGGWLDPPHVAGRGLLVVGLGDVRLVSHHAVGYVGPYLCLLPRRLGPLQHLVLVDVPAHRHLLLLPIYLHRLHSCNHHPTPPLEWTIYMSNKPCS